MQPTIYKGHMRQIGEEVAKLHGVTFEELIAACKRRKICRARYELYYNLLARTNAHFEEIARFCHRCTSTILEGSQKFMVRYNVPHPRTGQNPEPKRQTKPKPVQPVFDSKQGLRAKQFRRSWKSTTPRDRKILVLFYYSRGMSMERIAEAINEGRPGQPITKYAVRVQIVKLQKAGIISRKRQAQPTVCRAVSEEELAREKAQNATLAELYALEEHYPNGVQYSGNGASLNRSSALVPSFQHIWDRRLQFPAQIEAQQAGEGLSWTT